MTIYELKALNVKNGGKFFERAAMQFFGDTLRNLGIRMISKTEVEVYRKYNPPRSWRFNRQTGRMI